MGFSDTETEQEEWKELEENLLQSPEFSQMIDHYLYQGSILAELIESVEGKFSEFRFSDKKVRITIERIDDED